MSTRIEQTRCTALLMGAIICGALGSGCSSATVESHQMAAGTLRLPADCGMIGLTVARRNLEFDLEPPSSRREAAGSASAEGARTAAASELGLLFPAGFVLGGVAGLMIGIDEDALKRATDDLQAVARDVKAEARIADAVASRLAALGLPHVFTLEEDLPLEPVKLAGSFQWTRAGLSRREEPAYRPHPLHNTELKTLVGIRVPSFGFQLYTPPELISSDDINRSSYRHNPPLKLVLAVDVAAIRTRDWQPLGGVTVLYESTPRRFMEWAADNAAPLRRELDAGLQFTLGELALRLSAAAPASR